jgi:tight adherence protein B
LNAIVAATIGAAAVLVLFVVLSMVFSGGPNYGERLARFVGGKKAGAGQDERKAFSLQAIGESQFAATFDKAVGRQTFGRTVQRRLAQADLRLTIFEYMLAKALTTMAGAAVGLYLGRGGPVQYVLFGIAGVVLGFFAPDWFVKYRLSKRLKAFNEQLGDTIGLLANSLRSGYSLLQSMELVAKESPEPIASEFKRVVREVGLGLSAQEALMNLLKRMPSDDLDLMITAINIQYEVGGNLAQILDTLAHTIRERVRIKGEIRVLTAQGRVTGYIIAALPVLVAVAVTVINPSYMNTLWEFPWILMPICGGILMLIGFLIIRKIINIDV